MSVGWNLTRSARQAAAADVVVVSVGKSGRTWLRVMLNKYLSLHFGVPFGVENLAAQAARAPSLFYTHELWEYRTKASWSQRLRGKYLLPDSIARRKRLVLLYRDPRDVVVSLYFQLSRRASQPMEIDMSAFIRHPRFGIASIIDVLNIWRARFASHPHCEWLCYERMHQDPLPDLLRLLAFIGVDPVDPTLAGQAVEFSAFQNMRQMEARGEFNSRMLRPRDSSDPQSFKVREGKVGGYRKHFGDADLTFLDRAMARLDPFYGYAVQREG